MANSRTIASARDPGACQLLVEYGDLMTVEDVSDVLKVSERTVYRLVDKDELPCVKIGRRLYFPKNMMIERLQLERSCPK